MSVSKYHAWKFNHPDFDSMTAYPGLVCSHDGKVSLVAGAMAIRQSVLLLLSTMPGERIRRPSYGCELYRLTFMPNDPTTHGLAIHYVRQALAKWEPRIKIKNIDACTNVQDASKMELTLNYEITDINVDDELAIIFTLM